MCSSVRDLSGELQTFLEILNVITVRGMLGLREHTGPAVASRSMQMKCLTSTWATGRVCRSSAKIGLGEGLSYVSLLTFGHNTHQLGCHCSNRR